MFALMAECEAALIRDRTLAGLAAARARGRKGGRKPKMTPALIDKAQRMYDSRQFTMAEIARLVRCHLHDYHRRRSKTATQWRRSGIKPFPHGARPGSRRSC
jgi:DNA invertase Pin-like site-specific DNA recombinase